MQHERPSVNNEPRVLKRSMNHITNHAQPLRLLKSLVRPHPQHVGLFHVSPIGVHDIHLVQRDTELVLLLRRLGGKQGTGDVRFQGVEER